MKNISARDYDVSKTQFDFEKTPSGSDFFISDDGEGFSWSTNGKTLGSKMTSITRAAAAINQWAKIHDVSGSVWLIDGDKRKYVGKITTK
jgi:hypothetical protein